MPPKASSARSLARPPDCPRAAQQRRRALRRRPIGLQPLALKCYLRRQSAALDGAAGGEGENDMGCRYGSRNGLVFGMLGLLALATPAAAQKAYGPGVTD